MHFNQLKSAKHILIYGLGLEGKSSQAFLQKHFPDIKISIFDDFIPKYNTLPETEIDAVVVSAGVDRKNIPLNLKNKCTSNVEIFFQNIPESKRTQIIGISGTKGKSTTTKFCEEYLLKAHKKVAIGGNFGVPFLDLFDNFMMDKYDFIIAELSSYQLEHLPISPGIAIFLNLYPDHLERHGNMETYFAAKKNLWIHQKSGDHLIFSHPFGEIYSPETPILHVNFHKSPILSAHIFPKNSVFRASHFCENLGTLKALESIFGIDPSVLIDTAQNFKGLPHRLENFCTRNGIAFYDDTLSVNPHSTIAAINHFQSQLGSLILGGQSNEHDYTELVETFFEKVPQGILIILDSGAGKQILQVLKKCHIPHHAFVLAHNLEKATHLGYEKTPSGKACILSPAAKSFDYYKNYKEKGSAFKKFTDEY